MSKATAVERRNLSLEKVVNSLKPKAKEYRVYDAKMSGFGIRVAPNGARAYFIQYRNAKGVKRRMYLKDSDMLRPAEAHTIAQGLLGDVAKGRDPLIERRETRVEGVAAARAQRQAKTVDDVATTYLETLKIKKSERWATDAKKLYDAHLKKRLGSTKIADVTVDDVRALHERMHKTPYMANRVRAVLSAIITRAMTDDPTIRAGNPCESVEQYPEIPRDRDLKADEWPRLAKAIAAERAALLASTEKRDVVRLRQLDAILLIAMTGARVQAVLQRKWEQVDYNARLLHVLPPSKGTTRLYLGDATIAFLRSCDEGRTHDAAPSPYLFPGRIANTSIGDVRSTWDSLLSRAEIEDLTPHDLRRSFATVGADLGVSEYIMGGLLSHSRSNSVTRPRLHEPH